MRKYLLFVEFFLDHRAIFSDNREIFCSPAVMFCCPGETSCSPAEVFFSLSVYIGSQGEVFRCL